MSTILPRTVVRRRWMTMALLVVATYIGVVAFTPSKSGNNSGKVSQFLSMTSLSSPICTSEEISKGNWTAGPPLRTADEYRERFNYLAPQELGWEREFRDNADKSPEWKAEIMEKANKIASPILVPTRPGCRMYEFDRRAYIKRLLRSRGGLVLVGDSLTIQHCLAVSGMLHDGEMVLKEDYDWDVYVTVNPDHPEIIKILKEAGVDPARTKAPILSCLRHQVVVNDAELATLFPFAPTRFDPKPIPQRDWDTRLMTKMWLEDGFVKKELEEPTAIVFNIGAWWKHSEFGQTIVHVDLYRSFRLALKLIEDKMRRFPYPLAPYWRAVAPGHIDCEVDDELDNARKTGASPVEPEKNIYNYRHFEWMNRLAKDGHSTERSPDAFDAAINDKGLNPPYRVLDIWDISVKRPEAHLGPGSDCLHWYMPGGSVNVWQDLLWHQMMLEARNHDYY